jgi:ABC-type multidrug transport system ATPase subunit
LETLEHITVSVENLGKRFNREWILRNLTYTFESGKFYVFTGSNGSGKSTLLQILWGQLPPSTGKLTFTTKNGAVAIDDIYKHISIAAPYMDIIDELTLEEHLHFHFNIRQAINNMSVEDMLDRMYLKHARSKQIGNFSSGMRQRFKLGLAFFTKSSLVFLDEPTTNLDHQATDWYLKEVLELRSKSTVFLASNQPHEYPSDATILDITQYKKQQKV